MENKIELTLEDYEHYLPALLEKIKPHQNISVQKVKEAFYFAGHSHRFDIRKSGEPYIMHPVAAAILLLDHYSDEASVIATILHDTIEDTDVTYKEIEKKFGKDVAFLVESVSHFATATKESKDIQTIRKILNSMTKDFRVIYVKLADRLHNMLTLQHMPRKNQINKAKEVQEIYVGLARSFNLWSWKNTLADLCLQYLEPDTYEKLEKNIDKIIKKDSAKTKTLLTKIQNTISFMKEDIHSITLVKHSVSGILKILKGNIHPNINNIYYIEIIVKNQDKTYKVMGEIHKNFKMFNSKLRDYFSVPKENGYKALHTTIFSDLGLFDIKIKTPQNKNQQNNTLQDQIKSRDSGIKDHNIFKESLVKELFDEKIRVYSSLAGEKNLPQNSTVLDFLLLSYGKKALFFGEILVNDQKVDKDHILQHNDIIEVIFKSEKRPIRLEWFDKLKVFDSKQILIEDLGGEDVYENLFKGYKEFKYWQKVFDLPSLKFIYEKLEHRIKKRYPSFEFALVSLGKEEIKMKEFLEILIPINYFRQIESNLFSFSLDIDEINSMFVKRLMQLIIANLKDIPQKWENVYNIVDTPSGLNIKYHFTTLSSLLDLLLAIKDDISSNMKFKYIF